MSAAEHEHDDGYGNSDSEQAHSRPLSNQCVQGRTLPAARQRKLRPGLAYPSAGSARCLFVSGPAASAGAAESTRERVRRRAMGDGSGGFGRGFLVQCRVEQLLRLARPHARPQESGPCCSAIS
jgi:hypothetical protein